MPMSLPRPLLANTSVTLGRESRTESPTGGWRGAVVWVMTEVCRSDGHPNHGYFDQDNRIMPSTSPVSLTSPGRRWLPGPG